MAVQKIIEGTFVILILAWVLTHAAEFGQVAGSIGSAYTGAVNALKPTGA
jgi:hypothetical protein